MRNIKSNNLSNPSIELAASGESGDRPGAWRLFHIWFMIGAQSFGGGPATQQLIRREMINKRGWLTDLEAAHFWTLATLVPGINLISYAILIGRKLSGWPGIFATLVGMLLPSTAITIFLTASFVAIQGWPPFQSILRGVIPATAALMFVVVMNLGRPLLRESRRQGWANLTLSLLFLAGAALMIGLLKLPVWLALLLAIVAGPLLSSARFTAQLSPQKRLEVSASPATLEKPGDRP